MKAALTWRPDAEQALIFLYSVIHQEQPAAAERWFAAVLGRIRSLMELPRQGKRASQFGHGVRQLVVQKYLIFYRTIPDSDEGQVDEIVILNIVDGRIDLRRGAVR